MVVFGKETSELLNTRITELYLSGISLRKVSIIVGLSRSAVHYRLTQLGISRRKGYGGAKGKSVRKIGGKYCHNGYTCVILGKDDFFIPTATKCTGHILEHRLVMAKHLRRNLKSWEIVHHKNGIKTDNRIENLQLISEYKHNQITITERKIQILEDKVKRQGELIKLLQWQISQNKVEVI